MEKVNLSDMLNVVDKLFNWNYEIRVEKYVWKELDTSSYNINTTRIDYIYNSLIDKPITWVYKWSTTQYFVDTGHNTVIEMIEDMWLKPWAISWKIGLNDKWVVCIADWIKVADDIDLYKKQERDRVKKQTALKVIERMRADRTQNTSREFKNIVCELLKIEFFRYISNNWFADYIVRGNTILMRWLNIITIDDNKKFKDIYKLMVKNDIKWMREYIRSAAWEDSSQSVYRSRSEVEPVMEKINQFIADYGIYSYQENIEKDTPFDFVNEFQELYNECATLRNKYKIEYVVYWSDKIYDIRYEWTDSLHTRATYIMMVDTIRQLKGYISEITSYDFGKFYYITTQWWTNKHWIMYNEWWRRYILNSKMMPTLITDIANISEKWYITRIKNITSDMVLNLDREKQWYLNRVSDIMKWWDNSEEEKIMKQIELILDLEYVKDIQLVWETIKVITEPLYINKYYDEIRHHTDTLIWEFVIEIWIWKTASIRVKRQFETSWCVHPHVNSSWDFCVWDFWQTMYNAARNYDYVTCVIYTLEHLSTYNRWSPYERLEIYKSRTSRVKHFKSLNIPDTRPLTWFSKQISWSNF